MAKRLTDKELNSKTYLTSVPCKNGHLNVLRYINTGKCVECVRAGCRRRTKAYNHRTGFKTVKTWRANPINRRHELDLDAHRRKTTGLAKDAAKSARRRSSKLHATPSWSEKELIKQLYQAALYLKRLTGIKWDIDHEVPLKNSLVCGLHVYQNLQLLPHVDNVKKSNSFRV